MCCAWGSGASNRSHLFQAMTRSTMSPTTTTLADPRGSAMGDEWGALEHYLRVGAELLADSQDDEAPEPLKLPSAVEEVPA